MKKRTASTNRHSVTLNDKAYAVLKKARAEVKPPERPSFSAAVLRLESVTKSVTAPTSALVDLQAPELQQPLHHFTVEQTRIPGCSQFRDKPLSTAALIEKASAITGRSPSDFVLAAAVESARKAVIDRARAEAGATNAKGSADSKILAAIAQLKEAGETPTVARVRAMTRCNRIAVLRHFEKIPTPVLPPAPASTDAA